MKYICRMEIEKEELGKKIDNLEEYLKNNYNNLDDIERKDMTQQFEFMVGYYDKLSDRIKYEKEKHNII